MSQVVLVFDLGACHRSALDTPLEIFYLMKYTSLECGILKTFILEWKMESDDFPTSG